MHIALTSNALLSRIWTSFHALSSLTRTKLVFSDAMWKDRVSISSTMTSSVMNTPMQLASSSHLAQVKSMDDNCGEWVECMGVASGCGEKEVDVTSGSG